MAVRSALVPRLEDLSNEPTSAGFVPPSRTNSVINFSSDNTDVITTTVLRASALDKIQNFLLRGQKKQAYHYALDHQLWAHAMVIASGIDKESWQEVVKEFIKTELGSKDDPARILLQNQSTEPISPSVNGREGLRAVYGLLTGQGAASGTSHTCTSDTYSSIVSSRARSSEPPGSCHTLLDAACTPGHASDASLCVYSSWGYYPS